MLLRPGVIEDTYLDPIVTFQVRDSDPSVNDGAYGYVHLNLSYLPRGQPFEKWAIMDMIPEYVVCAKLRISHVFLFM